MLLGFMRGFVGGGGGRGSACVSPGLHFAPGPQWSRAGTHAAPRGGSSECKACCYWSLPPHTVYSQVGHIGGVKQPVACRASGGGGGCVSSWLRGPSMAAGHGSTDHYRYQALFPKQNDIAAFDHCSHSGQNSSTAKNTPPRSPCLDDEMELFELTTGHQV